MQIENAELAAYVRLGDDGDVKESSIGHVCGMLPGYVLSSWVQLAVLGVHSSPDCPVACERELPCFSLVLSPKWASMYEDDGTTIRFTFPHALRTAGDAGKHGRSPLLSKV